ncbi:DNA-methyltransferase [Schlesneria sp. T3-172]|uniref:DNA-methyltransferase n=1 Tax=Schlesneria sphaerica TaxID=3373610 RepID=UPI0037CB2AB0
MTGEIRCGDAVEVLKGLEKESIALTVTSPPYYKQRDYGVSDQIGQEGTLAEYLERIKEVLRLTLRATDRQGSCFLVIGDTYHNRKLLLVPHRIAIVADELGWVVRNDLIWKKPAPAPESPRNRWRSSHEHILFLTKRPSGYRFNIDAIRVPYADVTIRRWGNGQIYGGEKSKRRPNANDSRMRDGQRFTLNPKGCIPTDVLTVAATTSATDHYAAFSPELIRPIIETCSDRGDLVVDPFAGSGTTCLVANSLQRRFLGIELNPEYVRSGNARLVAPAKRVA